MASAAPTGDQQVAVVDMESLSLDQLSRIQRELDSEVQNLSLHLRSLHFAKNKLQESREALHLFCDFDSSGDRGQSQQCPAEEDQDGEYRKEKEPAGDSGRSDDASSSGKAEEGENTHTKEDKKKQVEEQLEVLVPLTASLYVKGRLTTREKLLVDIGTGYWVEKTGEEANLRLERTSKKVNEQVTKVERVVLEKQRQVDASRVLLQRKYLQQQLLQQQVLKQAGAGAGNK